MVGGMLIIGGFIFLLFLLARMGEIISPKRVIKIKPKQVIISDAPKTFNTPKIENTHSEIDVRNRNHWVYETEQLLLTYQSVLDITNSKDILKVGYSDLLNTIEWNLTRLKILSRDKYTCQDCKRRKGDLHVHHKIYIKNQLPWEIENDYLVSLCYECHKQRHDKTIIKVYQKLSGKLVETSNKNIYCDRCKGAGLLPQFRHVQKGICFKCKGDCISQSIFSDRLRMVNDYTMIYQDNLMNDISSFFNSISVEIYTRNIVDRTGFEPSDDLPF